MAENEEVIKGKIYIALNAIRARHENFGNFDVLQQILQSLSRKTHLKKKHQFLLII